MTKYLLLPILMVSSMSTAATQFLVVDKDGSHAVHSYNVDKVLRDIPADKLQEVSQYLAVSSCKNDRGEYMLHAHVKGLGGGPILGTICYWTTKTIGVAGIAVAVFFEPPLLFEAPMLYEGVEAASVIAGVAGTIAPTI